METVLLALGILTVLTVCAPVARRFALPLPLVLIAAGVALSFVPGFTRVDIDPEVFFLLFIPPLLFADGWLMPKRELLGVLRPVLLLAFGLVLLTVVVVGLALHALVPALPLAAAFALAAIVSPTDAVATEAMTARSRMPARARHILSGESLINDASGLVAFKVAVAAAATGVFSWSEAAGELVLLVAGGAAAGLAVAWLVGRARAMLRRLGAQDPHVQTLLSVLTPFAAYALAHLLDVSGILAAVAAGLYAGWTDFRTTDAPTRQHSWEVWAMLLFVFNGVVFLLLGLSLSHALIRLGPESFGQLALHALALWAALGAIRMAWVFPAAWLAPRLAVQSGNAPRAPPAGTTFLIGWAGLRGSVTMAAALSIPHTLPDATPFPGRDLIIFLAAATIVLTLVINGLSLPWLVRRLAGAGVDHARHRERRAAEAAIARAGRAALDAELGRIEQDAERRLAQSLIDDYARRQDLENADEALREAADASATLRRRLLLRGIDAEREALYALRDTGTINDDVVRDIEARLDTLELLATDSARRTT